MGLASTYLKAQIGQPVLGTLHKLCLVEREVVAPEVSYDFDFMLGKRPGSQEKTITVDHNVPALLMVHFFVHTN